MLDIWPALPIVLNILLFYTTSPLSCTTNIIFALQQHNRIYKIYIEGVPNLLLKEFAAMQESFLTELSLRSNDKNAPVLPDSFLGTDAWNLSSN